MLQLDPSLSMAPRKKVLIETWGCQMNVADSEAMLKQLETLNYELTQDETSADLVLLNTCHIREKARHKVLSRLGVLRGLKDNKPGMKIAVAGCVAQADGAKLIEQAPQIDVLLGPGKISEFGQLLKTSEAAPGAKAVATGFARHHAYETVPPDTAPTIAPTVTGKFEVTRYINIAQGCDNFCTFCVVPYTRGREISRLPYEIVAEAKALIASGVREIHLLGQNVNSYGHDLVEKQIVPATTDGLFVDLLREIAALPDLLRLRFTTSNPHDFSRPLADLFGSSRIMAGYLHLPVQSGNDEVLARMKRKVTRAAYLERISWLRANDPNLAISTDIIVGFPGETDAQFEDTMTLIEQVRYSFVFAFKYSPRKNTAAARFRDQISEEVKSARLARLNALQDRITLELNQAEIGQTRQVLFQYEKRSEPGVYYGRTEHYRLVRVPADRNLIGMVLPVEIYDTSKTTLQGRL